MERGKEARKTWQSRPGWGGGNSAAEAERGEVSLGQGSGQIEMDEQDGGLEISRGETPDEEVQEEEQDGGGGISRRESQDEEG